MAYVTKETARAHLALAERDEPSEVFGGVLRLRELTRAQFRACRRDADLGERAYLTRVGDQTVRITIDADRYNAGLFAAGVIDPTTGEPIWGGVDEMLALPRRATVWDEILRIANLLLDLSEVGPGALKSGSPADDAGRGD